ncbi:hypothetical protein E4K10_49460 [Streptomyces sp. T1317-0309]|nr:hypothetical protein E4K10_49460 [Streptomyces sp. T1317-0309]
MACRDWKQSGVALLRCGPLFCAVRISAQLVHAAAGATDPNEVDAYLAACFPRRPGVHGPDLHRYYALVRGDVAGGHRWKGHEPHAVGLSAASFLGVPDPACVYPYDRASYWCVPVKEPGALCTPSAVEQLIVHGRLLLARRRGEQMPSQEAVIDPEAVRETYNAALQLWVSHKTQPSVDELCDRMKEHIALLLPEVEQLAARMRGEQRRLGIHVLTRVNRFMSPGVSDGAHRPAGYIQDLAGLSRSLLGLYEHPGPLGEPAGVDEIAAAIRHGQGSAQPARR